MRSKTFLFAFALFVASLDASGQIFVDSVDINARPDVEFIEVSLLNGTLGWQGKCRVDHGQLDDNRMPRPTKIIGPNGEEVKFRSRMAALNFFFANGWEPVPSCIEPAPSGSFLLRRRKN